jgi:hypothetical protein
MFRDTNRGQLLSSGKLSPTSHLETGPWKTTPPVAAVVRTEDLNFDADESERALNAASPTNRTRLYDLVMFLPDDEIVPALTVLRSIRTNRK